MTIEMRKRVRDPAFHRLAAEFRTRIFERRTP